MQNKAMVVNKILKKKTDKNKFSYRNTETNTKSQNAIPIVTAEPNN